MIQQVLLQQGGGPNGRLIAEFSRIGLDDLGDQGIDRAVVGSGTTRTWGVRETFPQVQSGASLEPAGPVGGGLTTDAQGFGDRPARLPPGEPGAALGPAPPPGRGGGGGEEIQN